MRIGIKNNNNFVHTVCRINGQKININAKDFIIIDTDNEQEINYWTNIKKDVTDKIGISVATNETDILKLSNDSQQVLYNNSVSVVDNAVSPVAKQIAESINKNNIEDKQNYFYTKDQLLNMDKEDLINICKNFDLKFRKNSSVKTLVSLILGSGVL